MKAKLADQQHHVKQGPKVVPLHPEPSHEPGGLEVELPRRLPHIAPGQYEAVSVSVNRYVAFKRLILRIEFDVYDRDVGEGGVVLARLPMFCRWNGKKPAPSSKLGRLLLAARLESTRGRRVNLSEVIRKAWRVRVSDAVHDSQGQPLREPYSVIAEVLDRLA